MRPLAQADGHDAPWLIDEAVPGVAAMVHDVIVRGEDAVREPIVAHKLPDVLDRIEFRTFGRQRQESDVGRDLQRNWPKDIVLKLKSRKFASWALCLLQAPKSVAWNLL